MSRRTILEQDRKTNHNHNTHNTKIIVQPLQLTVKLAPIYHSGPKCFSSATQLPTQQQQNTEFTPAKKVQLSNGYKKFVPKKSDKNHTATVSLLLQFKPVLVH